MRAYGFSENGDNSAYEPSPQSEHRYRYGYRIGDGRPRYIGSESDLGYAKRSARIEAGKVRDQLRAFDAPGDVSIWVQRRTVTVGVEYDEPVAEPLP